MILVTVELISARHQGLRQVLAAVEICNDGKSDNPNFGDYEVRSLRGRGRAQLSKRITQRSGRVERHARHREHILNLVAKALANMGYGGNAPISLAEIATKAATHIAGIQRRRCAPLVTSVARRALLAEEDAALAVLRSIGIASSDIENIIQKETSK